MNVNVDSKKMAMEFTSRALERFFYAGCSVLVAVVLAVVVLPVSVYAQKEVQAEVAGTSAMEGEQAGEAEVKKDKRGPTEIKPNEMPSLLFTYWEHTAIEEAKRARGTVRPPTDAELNAAMPDEEGRPKPPPEERELRLAGIVYVANDDWTIWLNEKRVTPTAVPPEAIDLEVYKEFIELKWHDDYTNQIFPIRLRPHQRFNLDARIFLP